MNASASGAPGEPAGWFGKLACVGDFASRRLPPEFTQACDAWLSRCLETSRALLGERWLDVYLTSPLYRFAWAPGVIDRRWWFGAMMPSVDNVGRYFPLLIAQGCDEAPSDSANLDRLERWFEQLAGAALATLQPGTTLDRFEGALALAAPLPVSAATASGAEEQWPDHTSHAMPPGITLAQGLAQFAAQEALRHVRGCSIWWPHHPAGSATRLSVAVGLPAPESFARLLEAAW